MKIGNFQSDMVQADSRKARWLLRSCKRAWCCQHAGCQSGERDSKLATRTSPAAL